MSTLRYISSCIGGNTSVMPEAALIALAQKRYIFSNFKDFHT